jgi:predicted metal-binding membrane protein
MGVRHGLYCLGCCWALFAVLTAVGMMSIAWMLSLTLVVFAEKVFPYGVRISAAVGVALIAIGLLIASGALQQLPWRA